MTITSSSDIGALSVGTNLTITGIDAVDDVGAFVSGLFTLDPPHQQSYTFTFDRIGFLNTVKEGDVFLSNLQIQDAAGNSFLLSATGSQLVKGQNCSQVWLTIVLTAC